MRTTAWPAAARDNARLFFHSTVVLPDGTLQDGAVLCTEGRISAVGPLALLSVPDNATLFDARDGYVVPRFVDIHSHGGGGADFMDGTARRSLLRCRSRQLAVQRVCIGGCEFDRGPTDFPEVGGAPCPPSFARCPANFGASPACL
jgi:hypothetical protein